MIHLEKEIESLNEKIMEMINLVGTQLKSDHVALIDFDKNLAQDIDKNEKKVDKLELKIDRQCEHILALHNPVAVDLRFIIACFKINSDLERIGDHAAAIAKYMLDFADPIEEDTIKKMQLEEMFNIAIRMYDNVSESFVSENTTLARSVFEEDKILNKINRKISGTTAKLIEQNPDNIQQLLFLFSIIRKLERVGDLTKNVAEEIIFYIEAKVLKHKKEKIKKD
ncbi:MAG: phosphate signaling complex protein PhoU [Balneolaceae bacterium]